MYCDIDHIQITALVIERINLLNIPFRICQTPFQMKNGKFYVTRLFYGITKSFDK